MSKNSLLIAISIVVVIMLMMLSFNLISQNYVGTPENVNPIKCTVNSDLAVISKTEKSGLFCSIDSVDSGYSNVSNVYCYEYHDVNHTISKNIAGIVTGNTRGSVIIPNQFTYTNSGSNNTGSFKEFNGYVVMKNEGFNWGGGFTAGYVAISVNLEIFNNGEIFMQYSIAHSQKRSESYYAMMDITGLFKTICA